MALSHGSGTCGIRRASASGHGRVPVGVVMASSAYRCSSSRCAMAMSHGSGTCGIRRAYAFGHGSRCAWQRCQRCAISSVSRSGKSLDDDDGGELHLVTLEEMLLAVADAM